MSSVSDISGYQGLCPSVVLFGGSGAADIASCLKQFNLDISAVAPTTDNGGHTGMLRNVKASLPGIGDLRKLAISLSPDSTLAKFAADRLGSQYGVGLNGASLGNLLLEFLIRNEGGSLVHALTRFESLLNCRGRILPASEYPAQLRAQLCGGGVVDGEAQISTCGERIERVALMPANATAPPEVVEAILSADVVAVAPGSLFTSQSASVLPRGIAQAFVETHAKRVFIVNVANDGESQGFSASDHITAFSRHLEVCSLDYCFVNSRPGNSDTSAAFIPGYESVADDIDVIREMGYQVIAADFASACNPRRHNAVLVATLLYKLASSMYRRRASSHRRQLSKLSALSVGESN